MLGNQVASAPASSRIASSYGHAESCWCAAQNSRNSFPIRKTATVTYPVISGLSNRAVLRRIRSLLDFKNIFDYSLKEYREDTWLSEFSYDVNYNRNFLFDITFTQSGVAAYPDEHSKHFLINLKDGRIIKAADAFLVDKFGVLAALVDQKLQAELREITSRGKTELLISRRQKPRALSKAWNR